MCKQCNSLDIDDVVHFLSNRKTYENELKDLFHVLSESYGTKYDRMMDNIKCSRLLNMDIESQLVDQCVANKLNLKKHKLNPKGTKADNECYTAFTPKVKLS